MDTTEEGWLGGFDDIFEPHIMTEEEKKQALLMEWEKQLKNMPLEVIEQFLRKKKLEHLDKR